MRTVFIIIFTVLGLSTAANAHIFEKNFEEGNRLYSEAKYKAAAAEYQKVVDGGYMSSKLYYNLGNAYYKQKMHAKAILYYEKALILDPTDTQIAQNLELARLQTKDKIEAVPTFFISKWVTSFRDMLSANGWAWLSLVTILLAALFFVAYRFIGGITSKKINFSLSAFLLVVFFVSLLNASAKTQKIKHPNEAIVTAPVVVVKSSPDKSGKDLFVIHDGTKVEFTKTAPVPGWREIQIADGNTGWIESSTFEVI